MKLMGQGKPCPVGLGYPALKTALDTACEHAGTVPMGTAEGLPSGLSGHDFGYPVRAISAGLVTRDCIAAVSESPNQAGLKNFLGHGKPLTSSR